MRPLAAFCILAHGALLAYSQTYLGASGAETGVAVAPDPSGNILFAGSTDSGDFPVTANAYPRSVGSASIAGFIARFDRSGSNLIYATYLTGRADTAINRDGRGLRGQHGSCGSAPEPGSFSGNRRGL